MQKKTFNDNFKSHSISVLYILKNCTAHEMVSMSC